MTNIEEVRARGAIVLSVGAKGDKKIAENSKEVITHGEYFYKWDEVTYNNTYVIGIISGVVAAIYTGCLLFGDVLSSKIDTIEANGNYITIYKANTANIVYVNGEEKGRLTFFSFSHYIEIKLPDGVKATISFGRGLFMPVHVSYSDNTPSVDL